MMEPADVNDDLGRLATGLDPRARVRARRVCRKGPVKFLLVSGQLDDSRWGLVGAFWVSIDGARGGFFVAPDGIWRGSEMVRSYRSARGTGLERREHLHATGRARWAWRGRFMIDPQQHADTLFQVARRVGAL